MMSELRAAKSGPFVSVEHDGRARAPLIIDGRMLFMSGIGRYLREILQRAPESIRSSVRVLCNSPEQGEWLAEFVPSIRPIESKAGIYSFNEQLLALPFPANATLWVPHYNVPWMFRCKLIATVHDLAPLALPEAFGGLHRRMAARFYFSGVRRRANQIIAVSNFTRSELIARGVATTQNISVIPNGVGPSWFDGSPATERLPQLLFVGNLKPHKNLSRLVDALELVRRIKPVDLVVAGRIEGFRTGLSGSLIDRLRATRWIRLLGTISDSELQRQYRQSSALVFPSLYEGFGLPILEAMAAGCPVISSNAPALSEVGGSPRSEGGIVDYFDPRSEKDMAAAILRNLQLSASERARMAEEGRRLAGRYTWERTARATWQLLLGRIDA